jgi:phosphoglycerate dehydrogenase-like enzyme
VPARVACLSPWSEDTVKELLGAHRKAEIVLVSDSPPAPEAVREAVALADVVIGDKRHLHRLGQGELEAMTRCRLIQMPSVGFDVVDHRAAAELGIPVANAAGYNRQAVADWTLMAMLELLRMGAWRDRRMREGAWPKWDRLGRELGSLTVGIVGLGNVGSAVAARLRGFGARILFHDIVPRSCEGAEPVGLDELLRRSDVVCIHTVLDNDTRGLVGTRALGLMKPGAYLVNAARGPIVDEAALTEALTSGHLAGAALDVFEVEPLAADSPLRGLDNVYLSPHVAGITVESEAFLLQVVRENVVRVLDGEEPMNVVNNVVAGRPRQMETKDARPA